MKSLIIHGHWGGPNPWKVRTILEELTLPFEWKEIEFSDVKGETYTNINPNGRLPAMEDPNTGITLWESGAIILYLIDEYDKDHKLSYTTAKEKYLTQQWLMFQVSGQGPPFGQLTWFARFFPEKIPSVINRFLDETVRVIAVIDLHLTQSKTPYLVGEKCTYADLSFMTWMYTGLGVLRQLDEMGKVEGFGLWKAWMERVGERMVVKTNKGLVEKAREERKFP